MIYAEYLARKLAIDPDTGIEEPGEMHSGLFGYQADIVRWALRRGRAAVFAGTGLGKTLMEIAWADRVARFTGKPVLILTPLAVAAQFVAEGARFGIPVRRVGHQADVSNGVYVTNYDKLARFDLSAFGGLVLDESSILKAHDGKTRAALIEAAQSIPFRLAATATPAPNDYMELGNHAQFLGVMSYAEMLAMFFVHDGGDTAKWRLKGHAQSDFWQWMCSWSVMLTKPSDLGYGDTAHILPPLMTNQHTVAVEYRSSMETGLLFPVEARTMQERIGARRDSIAERVKCAFSLIIGSYVAKLAACHGNQNTPNGGALDTNLTHPNASDAKAKGERRKKMPNTCEPITSSTPQNSNERQSNRPQSTSDGGRDMPQTLNTATSANDLQSLSMQTSGDKAASVQNTAWRSQTMTPCSPANHADVPSVAISQSAISTLITAMTEAKSEGYFAARATQALEISRMTQSGLIRPWCIWCNLNSEQDALAKLFGPLAFSVQGSMTDDQKEAAIDGWKALERPILISKPSIVGFGMNFQHCADTAFVGLNDSFEQVFQAVRRFWRFGQKSPVNVHFIAAETEGAVVANLQRKEAAANAMIESMVHHMADITSTAIKGVVRDKAGYEPRATALPSFWEAA